MDGQALLSQIRDGIASRKGVTALRTFATVLETASALRSTSEAASRARSIGAENAALRAVRAARLIGSQRAAVASQGTRGPGSNDLLLQSASFEGRAIGRLQRESAQREEAIAAAGRSAVARSILGFVGGQIVDPEAGVADLRRAQRQLLAATERLVSSQASAAGQTSELLRKKISRTERRAESLGPSGGGAK